MRRLGREDRMYSQNKIFSELSRSHEKLDLEPDTIDIIDNTILFNQITFDSYFIIKNDGILVEEREFLKYVGEENNNWSLVSQRAFGISNTPHF